jgi:DNA mismatch repair protein MutS
MILPSQTLSPESEPNKTEDNTPTKLPPMLAQYLDYKRQYPDALLFFQVGDFYELFFTDAITVSRTLNLTLTSRDKNSPDPIPMCGVPMAVVDGYVDRLVAAGFSVAIVSQGPVPQSGKGMVPRRLERIVTPGITILGGASTAAGETLVAAIGGDPDRDFSIAFSNVQSSRIRIQDGIRPEDLALELGRLGITEVVIPPVAYGKKIDRRSPWVKLVEGAIGQTSVKYRSLSSSELGTTSGGRQLSQISGFASIGVAAKQAVRLLVEYIDEITVETKLPIQSIEPWSFSSVVMIDAPTRKNLELVANTRDARTTGTLFEYLNECRSAAGARLLYSWVLHPSAQLEEIEGRQKAVSKLVEASDSRADIRARLSGMVDFERIAARIELGVATPKELGALRDAVIRLPEIQQLITSIDTDASTRLSALAPELELSQPGSLSISATLEKALSDEPPHVMSEGGIIREGYDKELDHLRSIHREGRSWLAELEEREISSTGISSLKVRFNNVLGYYIEVTKANLSKVPDRFIRRQSTANSDRFTTPELAKLADDVLGAEGRIIDLERRLFEQLRAGLLPCAATLRRIGEGIATLDILQGFAELAVRDDLTAPELAPSSELIIEKGKHPVIARYLREQFVPNTIEFSTGLTNCILLTGPNMGGKSTYLRQAALIVIMAQLGAFVPAKRAKVGIVDKIFARIGASDNLSEGESTFMVEMREAAHIVASATPSSLVLIDEVGRGTATADGLAIAQAILEWLLVQTKSRTLFATHFHELTALEVSYPALRNLSVGSVEREDQVLFTHEIQQGPANRSYGLEVAKLAGLPVALIERARELLLQGADKSNQEKQLSIFAAGATPFVVREQQSEPADYKELRNLADEVRRIDINSTTPLEALLHLERLGRYARNAR